MFAFMLGRGLQKGDCQKSPGSMAAWKRILIYRHNQDEISSAVVDGSRSSEHRFGGANQNQVDHKGQQKVCHGARLLLCDVRIEQENDSTK